MTSKTAIEAAAKAIDNSGFCHPHPTWKPAPHLIKKWQDDAQKKAIAALNAASAIDGDYNAGVEDAKKLIAEEFQGAFKVIGDDIISKLEKLKRTP